MGKIVFDSPLKWPSGKPEATRYADDSFQVTPGKAIDELQEELGRLNVSSATITADWDLGTRDNFPLAKQRLGRNPAVAVHFERRGKSYVVACDRYNEHWKNCRGITIALQGFRSMERHLGTGFLEQAMEGFLALPPAGPRQLQPASTPKDWPTVLGVSPSASLAEIKEAWKRELERHHPDKGGNPDLAALINACYEQAKKEKGGSRG